MPHRAAMRKRSKVRRRMGWVEAAAWTLGFLMLGSYVAGRWYFSHSGDTAVPAGASLTAIDSSITSPGAKPARVDSAPCMPLI